MPCRDYIGEEIDAINYRKRCDELAAQLCNARQVLYRLHLIGCHRESYGNENPPFTLSSALGSDLLEDITTEIEGLKNHRDRDKAHAVLELGHSINRLRDDVKKIKSLGGKPGNDILNKIKDLKSKQKEMKESNPLHTNLY